MVWLSEYDRLMRWCRREVDDGAFDEARQAFDLLFDLLYQLDQFEEDILFFVDEAGSWQVGVDWRRVLPAWLTSLSETVTSGEVEDAVDHLESMDIVILLGSQSFRELVTSTLEGSRSSRPGEE